VTNVEDSQPALRDSKTTIRQGNNIRILTYVTAGNIGFAIQVVIFILGTYVLALSLENIIGQVLSTYKREMGSEGPDDQPDWSR
jgi:hypothetical protein